MAQVVQSAISYLEDDMSVYITRNMLGPASYEDRVQTDGSLLARVMGSALRRWQKHRMRQALERLDDRTLADIGVYRGDIAHIVGGFTAEELRMVPLARGI